MITIMCLILLRSLWVGVIGALDVGEAVVGRTAVGEITVRDSGGLNGNGVAPDVPGGEDA